MLWRGGVIVPLGDREGLLPLRKNAFIASSAGSPGRYITAWRLGIILGFDAGTLSTEPNDVIEFCRDTVVDKSPISSEIDERNDLADGVRERALVLGTVFTILRVVHAGVLAAISTLLKKGIWPVGSTLFNGSLSQYAYALIPPSPNGLQLSGLLKRINTGLNARYPWPNK